MSGPVPALKGLNVGGETEVQAIATGARRQDREPGELMALPFPHWVGRAGGRFQGCTPPRSPGGTPPTFPRASGWGSWFSSLLSWPGGPAIWRPVHWEDVFHDSTSSLPWPPKAGRLLRDCPLLRDSTPATALRAGGFAVGPSHARVLSDPEGPASAGCLSRGFSFFSLYQFIGPCQEGAHGSW